MFEVIFAQSLISGAHFNPAVSLGVALSGKLNPLLAALYWAAQLAGGFGAAILAMVRFHG